MPRVSRKRITKDFDQKSKTEQCHAGSVNINNIMARAQRNGMIRYYRGADFGDFTKAPGDFHQAMCMVRQANDLFMSLPSNIRKEFKNDPQSLINFLEDPTNRERGIELGLVDPRPEVNDQTSQKEPQAVKMEEESKDHLESK